jgi:heme exporter protein A
MIDVTDLSFDYPDKPVFNGVHLSVPAGCLLHLQGRNGSGKTTLLKLLSGLLRPMGGEIVFQGASIYDDLASYQQQLCYVGHKNGVSQLLTIREHCAFEFQHRFGLVDLDELLHSFGLDGLEDVVCGLLSVGQRRRVGLLRLFLSNAPMWLLDEPLAALDTDTVARLMVLLEHHLLAGGMIIVTSHHTVALRQGEYREYVL